MKKQILILVSLFFMVTQTWADSSTYLNFTAVNGPATIGLANHSNPNTISLQYSTDSCVTWNIYSLNSTIQLIDGSTVFFKATTTNSQFSSGSSGYCYFMMTGSVYADGNIMSLLDSAMQQTSVPDIAFYSLFKDCSSLKTAPALPATTLGKRCYQKMFEGCDSLIVAPALPATVLNDSCYEYMFKGCKSLTTTPVISAMTLASNCCKQMFKGCESLTTALALPATTLASNCYESMFEDCYSLSVAPALPATTLANYCYENMFEDCYSLSVAPALPATTLADGCYKGMFAINFEYDDCCVTSTPNGSLHTAPALPAMNLATSCYESMFENCFELKVAPTLPATTLAPYCYKKMFANNRGNDTRQQMYWQRGLNDWLHLQSSLKTAPELPATTLSYGCYESMFENCDSLIAIPNFPVISYNNHNNRSHYRMFYGCCSLIVNDTAPGTTWELKSIGITYFLFSEMLSGTGGNINGTPSENVKYYVASDPNPKKEVLVVSNDELYGSVSGGGYYHFYDTVTLTAIPNSQYRLYTWSNGDTCTSTHIIVNSDTTITAEFIKDYFSVSAVANSSIMGTVNGGGQYRNNKPNPLNVTLTAIPNPGYFFKNWSNGDTNQIISINVVSDTIMTAYFVEDSSIYNVLALSNYADRGVVTGSGNYNCRDIATLSATPNSGYEFRGWSNGETDNIINIKVVCDTSVTAYFELEGTGIDYADENNITILAPNPVKVGETICIKGDFTDEETDGMVVEILSTDGTLVSRTTISTTTIELDGINVVGTYIVRITTGAGKVYVEKLMVK